MSRVAILGGTFDPIHRGHVRLAEEARAKIPADRVILVPAAAQPLKAGREVAPAADRLAMARLAAAGHPWLEVSDIETRRPPPSYTVETLRALRAAHPAAELFFVAGADALRDIERWYLLDEILALATFVVASRPGFDPAALPPALRGRARVLPIDALPVSASEVRARLAAGEDAADVLDPAVLDYIRARGLYGATSRAG